jgi:alkylation response protein AidB-like acyl-CoA dehydrogenase
MTGPYTEIHDELREVARTVLAKGRTDHGGTVDWPAVAHLGWAGLEIPDHLGGAGTTFAEVAVLLAEFGRAATDAPYLGATVLGVPLLVALTPTPERDALLAATAAGARVAVALDAQRIEPVVGFRIDRAGPVPTLSGRLDWVLDAPGAEHLLIPAVDGSALVIVHVPSSAVGVSVERRPLLDETRRAGFVIADAAPLGDADIWTCTGDPAAALAALADRAALAVAIDALGVSEAMVDATVAYAGLREQFGRPIGSFQAVKHACADMLVRVCIGRELVELAIEDVVSGAPGAAVAVAMAKANLGDAAVAVAGAAMQLHGGIGYTWESGIHVYLKRATLDRALFGSPRVHRRRIASRYQPPE